MLTKLINSLLNKSSKLEVHAHCDGPCGVYDPASTRVAAEAVLAMTKKLIALTPPSSTDSADWAAYSNTFSRFVAVKDCLLYTSPSPRDGLLSRMPSSA